MQTIYPRSNGIVQNPASEKLQVQSQNCIFRKYAEHPATVFFFLNLRRHTPLFIPLVS